MAKGGIFDFREIKKLQKKIERLEAEKDKFCEACARELAARLLRKIIMRTPVGDYSGGKYNCKARQGPSFTHQSWKRKGMVGGTLRRGWTTQSSGSGAEGLKSQGATQYAETLKVHHFADTYVIEVTNSTEYASYVEYGHRTARGNGWVPGHFMLTISEKEINDLAPKLIEKKLEAKLREVFDA